MSHRTPLHFIRWFADISIADIPLVGGKNASLGEMFRELAGAGVRVPDGFAITAEGYRHFMTATGLDQRIAEILRTLDTSSVDNLQRGQPPAPRRRSAPGHPVNAAASRP